jgi:hypothetical protein
MRLTDRIVLRGLQPFLPAGAEVLVVERVKTDALGEVRPAQAVLTHDDLFLSTQVRLKSVLTRVPRADIRSMVRGPDRVTIGFEDYARARHRVIELELRRKGDRRGFLALLTSGTSDDRSGSPPGAS